MKNCRNNHSNCIEIIRTEVPGSSSIWTWIFAVQQVLLFSLELSLPTGKTWLMLLVAATSAGVVAALNLMERRHSGIWIYGCVFSGICLTAAGILYSCFVNGWTVYLNGLISVWNEKTENIYHMFETDVSSEDGCLVFFLLLCAALLSLWTQILIYYRKKIAIQFLNIILFAFAAIPALRLPVWIVLWTGFNIVFAEVFAGKEPGAFFQKKREWFILAAGIFLFCAAVIGATYLVHEDYLTSVKKKMIQTVEKAAYGSSDLTDGDLLHVKDKPDSESPRMVVHTSNDDSYYLRGFVGSVYTGAEWETLPEGAYQGENQAMLQWLEDTGNHPVHSLATSMLLSESYDPDSYEIGTYTYSIENKGAFRKYLYLPYAVGNVSFLYTDNFNRDLNVQNSLFGQVNSYEVNAVSMPISEYDELRNNGALTDADVLRSYEQYFSAEQAYRDFAETCYLDVPGQVRQLFDQIPSEEMLSGAKNITRAVRKYLAEQITYSETVDVRQPEEPDFVSDLILCSKKGYSVHFATVATLLFRYYGIPARYVEGYLCPEGGETITASDAHAWVEIYRYGFGWVPVEVTPGYYDNSVPEVTDESTGVVSDVDESQSLLPDSSGLVPVDKNEEVHVPYQWIILLVFLILLLLLFAAFIRRRILLAIRVKKTHGPDPTVNLRNMMKLIRKNAAKTGIRIREDFPDDNAKAMDEAFQDAAGVGYFALLNRVNHAHYSRQGISAQDLEIVELYMNSMARFIYEKSKKLKQLKLKYIDVLC